MSTAKAYTPTEAEVQRTTLAFLAFVGVLAWRNNTGAFQGEHKGRRRFVRFGKSGHADLFFVLPGTGRFGACELKRHGKRPTPKQLAFLIAVNNSGGFAFWADSTSLVEHVIRAALVNPRIRVEILSDGTQYLTDEEPAAS